MSFLDHKGLERLWAHITSKLSNKVDKIEGKGLSTSDYTPDEKAKLALIAEEANKTIVDNQLSNSSANPVENQVINAALNTKVPTTRTINGKALSADITLVVTDIANAASQDFVRNEIANAELGGDGNEVDLSGYATKDEVTALVGTTPVSQQISSAISTQSGAANGIASLDSNGKVPSAQLPSYVDDVIEAANLSAFPNTGEAGKIYVAQDTNKTYRWSGSAYVEISQSLALGTTSSTAYRGDYGAAAYAHAVTNKGIAKTSGLYKITTNSEGHVTVATAVVKSDITGLGIPAQDTTYSEATTSKAGLMSVADKTKLDGIISITTAEINTVCV